MEDKKVWKSDVWHEGKCFYVSTITRDFETYEGSIRGEETLVWEFDWNRNKRGELVGQFGGILDHQAVCRFIIAYGTIPDTEDERFVKFR